MIAIPSTTPEARKLFHDGADVLARVEANGMKIDVALLDATIENVGRRIASLEARLRECDEFKLQQREFGVRCNISSRDQLARVLFGVMGHEPQEFTSGGQSGNKRPQLNEVALERIGTKYCRGYLRMEKLRKLLSTHLKGIRRGVVDGFLHCSFPLNTVRTYRGASSDPNFTNVPIRDPALAMIIRPVFIPRPGHVLLEIDLKSNEVRVACCYTGDERLTNDTLTGDMHGDMAAEVFCLPRDGVPKNVRQEAKGKFVFAAFYGDYWGKIAPNLWDAIDRQKLANADGLPMKDHLAAAGIRELGLIKDGRRTTAAAGSFAAHIQAIENDFWNKRYSVYNQWRKDWFDLYCERGWYQMKTGFVCREVYSKNQVNNGAIQGSAFHCLLWVLIRLHWWLRKHKMRTVIIGQIHDSAEIDAHRDELEDVKAKVKSLLEDEIRREWEWLTVPLAGEAKVGAENWLDMVEVEL